MAPILTQVGGDAVGATAFARFRGAGGIGLVGLARLAQSRDVINVDVEAHAPLPSDHFVNVKVVPVMRRLALLVMLGTLGCGSRPTLTPEPQTPNLAVVQFLAAVKARDLVGMGRLWGDKDGPARERLADSVLTKRLTVIQIYLAHDGYRVIEGPTAAPGRSDAITFKVELQRARCNQVQPIDVVHTRRGGWLINDVHLETAGNPASACKPGSPGTGS
jgi:hypothetical protein